MADRTDTFYPAEGAIHGYGAQLMLGDDASPPGDFQAIATVSSITPGAMTTADIDRTHLRSPDAHHEHMPGLRDSAAFTAQLVWDPLDETHSNTGGGSGPFADGGLIAKWRARTIHNWKIVLFRDGSPSLDWPFRAYISQFQPSEIGVSDKINASVSFMPTEAYDADLP